MSATAGLTSDLQKQVLLLEDDLRSRVQRDPERLATWQGEHDEAIKRERTSLSWVEWRDDRVTQSAVAWVLTTVFVRFCEDNGLVKPVWIAGSASRRQEALDAQLAFFRANPEETDREWLQETVDYLSGLPSTATLVDAHSALHSVSPSGDAATGLLAFWRRKDDAGQLVHDLSDSTLSTRFLGDLYQDLSLHAKKTFALLQTPVFVEEFILDQALEPALAERPLEGFKLIDPTCGSGHFLLGAFARLLARWDKQAPGLEVQARVQLALDSIHGVDLNPFAVAIARFRLMVAALQTCGLSSLDEAPAFKFHLAAGDSLLHGQTQYSMSYSNFDADSALSGFVYATEDLALLREILQPGRYDVVVGNPPYITVKDKTLNMAYREIYTTCKGTYALTVPFMERFFGLAKPGSDAQPAGWTGQITSNSFMKRGFGSKLIEEFLAAKDLRLVVNSEGAWIPGHNTDGTPTVIITGCNRAPVGSSVRAVLSKGRRETRSVGDEGHGPYWQSIVSNIDHPGHDDDWVTVTDVGRGVLNRHPWSLSGGASSVLMTRLATGQTLASRISPGIGRAVRIGSDDGFVRSRFGQARIESADRLRPYLQGEDVRDYRAEPSLLVWYPYEDGRPRAGRLPLELWPYRTVLAARGTFQGNMSDAGREWWEFMQHTASAYSTPLSISFSNISSHNHFGVNRGNTVFNAHAPVIKLPEGATENDHLALLALLNSSSACFWLKDRSQPKGGAADHLWLRTYEFTGTTLQDYPLPPTLPLERGRMLDRLASELAAQSPKAICLSEVPTAKVLTAARSKSVELRAQLTTQQEELDWEVYGLYRLIDQDLTYGADDLPTLALGERAFEIALARRVASGDEESAWFSHPLQASNPVTEIPSQWPAAYRELVQRRLDVIGVDPSIGLLEKPECKRRWASEPWGKQQTVALGDWLLDRLEDKRFWFDPQGRPQPRSVAQLADNVSRDVGLASVLALWEGRPDVPVSMSLDRLLADESMPYLAAYRLNDSGLRKREAWEQTWALQRREDEGEKVGVVPVPPKYTNADFRKASWWQARGKLDVPKERFILYLDAGRGTDPTPLLGWAGWDHAQQSLALSLVIGAREADGWDDSRLVPLVAGLAELQPWVEQWHAEIDPTYGVSLAAFCREQLTSRASQVGKSLEELADWRPEAATRGRNRRRGALPHEQSPQA